MRTPPNWRENFKNVSMSINQHWNDDYEPWVRFRFLVTAFLINTVTVIRQRFNTCLSHCCLVTNKSLSGNEKCYFWTCLGLIYHLAYLSDLDTTYYHLFRSVQHTHAGQSFHTEAQMRSCIDTFIIWKPFLLYYFYFCYFSRMRYACYRINDKVIDANDQYFDD